MHCIISIIIDIFSPFIQNGFTITPLSQHNLHKVSRRKIQFKSSYRSIISLFFYKYVKKNTKLKSLYSYSGVGERVRSSAPIARPSSLANCPLHHLGTPTLNLKSQSYICLLQDFFVWRRGWDSNPRYAMNARQFSRLVP